MKNKTIKRHFYNGKDYHLDFKKKVVILEEHFFTELKSKKLWGKFGFKKIGGSSIGDVLKVDNFKSEFAAFCRIAWIGLPILNRKYVDAGIAIEPKVIAAIEYKTKLTIQTFDPQKYEYDYFKGKDDVLGGLPDGYIQTKNLVLEIKTTGIKNLENWKKYGIPASYLKQSQLYAYLMEAPQFTIVATFLEEEDYLNPEQFPISDRKIRNWNFKVDINQVLDDIDKVKKWYKKYTKSGISPQYDEVADADLLLWLNCSNETERLALKSKWIKEGKIK